MTINFRYIRPLVLGLFRNKDQVLVTEGFDSVKKQKFYRLPGGGIEFGERAKAALKREMLEEFNVKITNLKYLGTLENIFVFNKKPGHEIIFVYEGKFLQKKIYKKSEIFGYENGKRTRAFWLSVRKINNKNPLYPPMVLDLSINW